MNTTVKNQYFNSIQFSPVQFNGYFVMRRLNGTNAVDKKASIKAQTQQKRVQITKKLNLKNKNNMTRKRAKNLNSEKII